MLRDLGWDLGEPAILPSLWFPEDVKLTAFEVVQLEVEELAFVNEDNGGRYLVLQRRRLDLPRRRRSRSAKQRDAGHARRARPRTSRTAAACGSAGCACASAATSWPRRGCSTASACSSKVGRFELSGSGSDHRRHPRRPPLPRVRARPAPAVPGDGQGLQHRRAALLRPGHRARRQLHLLAVRAPAVATAPSARFELRGIRPARGRRHVAGPPRAERPAPGDAAARLVQAEQRVGGAVEVRSDREPAARRLEGRAGRRGGRGRRRPRACR